MFTAFFESPCRVQELQKGPQCRLLESFAGEICRARYAQTTARRHIRAAEHLIFWADRHGIPITAFGAMVVERFALHLDRCRCPRFGRAHRAKLLHGARLFVGFIRHCAVVTTIDAEPTLAEPLLIASFCQWMRQQRGICDSTLHVYRRDLRALLNEVGEDPGKFNAQGLRRFVLGRSRSGWAAAKTCTAAVRMFLRFLIANGKCSAGLDAAIPALAHWRLSSLPRYLRPDEVERVLASCNAGTRVGMRDRAIMLLLARLGLRAGDIVQLRLGDIDWKEGCICVSGKGQRQTLLPLTQELGDAIVSYIKDSRPPADTDRLFLCALAPFRAFRSQGPVSAIVAHAMRRAGVTCPCRGAAHVLRHSVATSMLRHGASLQEIAALLRHRSTATTEIYAKVDVATLRQIAQPWPGVKTC